MDYTEMLRDSFAYTRQGILGNGGRWMRLILATILLAIPMNGYMVRVYRGTDSAPEVDQWGSLFIDGLKLMVIAFIYSIPIFIVWLLTYGSMITILLSGNPDPAALSGWEPNMGLVVLMYLAEIAVALVLPTVSVRFARTGSFSEAFNFRAITDHIGTIGWINYVIAVFLVAILIAVPVMVIVFIFVVLGIVLATLANFSFAAIVGLIAAAVLVFLLLMPLFMVFQARYWSRLYDSAAVLPQ